MDEFGVKMLESGDNFNYVLFCYNLKKKRCRYYLINPIQSVTEEFGNQSGTLLRYSITLINSACNKPRLLGSMNSGSGAVLSSVIFNSSVEDNDSKLKESVLKIVIKVSHTAKQMNRELTD